MNKLNNYSLCKIYFCRTHYPDSVPQCYQNFLREVSSNVPCAGIMQVTSKQSISILKNFCKQKLDLRNGEHKSKLDHICSQIPVFWRLLNSICVFEESNFLPKDVATIVLKMIHIRNETFKVQRYKEDYIEYKEPGVFLNT